MKLLIVDDEQLTREGIVSSVDWETVGITEVLEADDGVNGLEMAKRHQPDIVLCDVRMPRMDGIAMLERIEALFPDTVAIFMSGYSDKEYLVLRKLRRLCSRRWSSVNPNYGRKMQRRFIPILRQPSWLFS